MQLKLISRLFGAIIMTVILSSCGGGGGSGSALQTVISGPVSSNSNSSSSVNTSAVGADTLQSMKFADASPETLNLKGTGGAESSLVRFQTLGQTGLPIKDIAVDFTVSSELGGIKLSQNSGVSDKDGYVYTSVISGTVSTSMRVVAVVKNNPSISAQSNKLVISTGLPDQKSMSLSVEKFNPAGWGHDGITSSVKILLADAYNNPVANGTAVYFTTEGGSIGASCLTEGGGCSVKWTSQSPRPTRNSTDNSLKRILCLNLADDAFFNCQAERGGRSTILATAVGNESFKDQNGNGVYDPDLDVFATSKDAKCQLSDPISSYESTTFNCDDLPEAYLDTNENGVHDTGEPFNNFTTDTSGDVTGSKNYSPNNGLYNGALCQSADEKSGKCSRAPISIRKQHMIIMSCDDPLLDASGNLPLTEVVRDVNNNIVGYTFAVADCNGNALPLGSTIKVGSADDITVGNQYNWTPISAVPGIAVKLTISVDGATKVMNVMTGSALVQ